MSTEPFTKIKQLFAESLCSGQLGFEEDGYLSACAINTYVLAVPLVLLSLYSAPQLSDMGDNGPRRTRIGHIKMLLTVAHVLVLGRFGPEIYNVLSLTVSLFTLLAAFILNYLEINGVQVPRNILQIYYYIWTVATGYLALKLIADRINIVEDPRPGAAAAICAISFLNGAFRNIADTIEPETIDVKEKQE